MNFNQIFRIAVWEFKQAIKSKTMLVVLFALPLLFQALLLPYKHTEAVESQSKTVIGILDPSGNCWKSLLSRGITGGKYMEGKILLMNLHRVNSSYEQSKTESFSLLNLGSIDGILEFGQDSLIAGLYCSRILDDVILTEWKSNLINAGRKNISPKELVFENQIMHLEPKLVRSGKIIQIHDIETKIMGSFILILLFFSALGISGNWFIRSFAEEKNNRLLEVLISCCSGREIVMGKFLGLFSLVFMQGIAMGLLSLLFSGGVMGSVFFSAGIVPIFVVLCSGILFFIAVFMFIGIIVDREIAAQSIGSIISLLAVVPLIWVIPYFYMGISPSRIFTWCPFFIPGFSLIALQDGSINLLQILIMNGLLIVLFLLIMSVSSRRLQRYLDYKQWRT
ncbi:MAG: ABC transporter permease [Ignavibacteria bacterium]|nr:ABC transporter permease [Ignavibacteria bacterium]